MSTTGTYFNIDYDGALASGLVGTLAAGTPSGVITLGPYRIFKIVWVANTTGGANNIPLRFTLGNTKLGHTAPTPTVNVSPFLVNNQENIFEFSAEYDSINLETFAADGAPASTIYSIIPLSRF